MLAPNLAISEDGLEKKKEQMIAPSAPGIVHRFQEGLHSVVRKLVFGKQDCFEKYLGYMVAAFTVNGYRPRDEDAYVSYSLPRKQVAPFTMRDDRTMFLFVFADEKD